MERYRHSSASSPIISYLYSKDFIKSHLVNALADNKLSDRTKFMIDWLIEWCFTPLSTVFQSYHGDSSHYSCLSLVSPVLGWGSAVSCPRTLPWKTQRIQCGSNPGPLDYDSNTLPLSHTGPQNQIQSINKCCSSGSINPFPNDKF